MSPSTLARRIRLVVPALGLLLLPAAAFGASKTFTYTGAEQTYTVPTGVTSLYVTAIGARGGGPIDGTTLTAGRGALVTGTISVTPGQTLFVEVGGIGGEPDGGWNGGGAGGSVPGWSTRGGGGASDVRTADRTTTDSLLHRLVVAGAGSGSAYPGMAGSNAGFPGTGCCKPGPTLLPALGGGVGTQDHGGAGGCTLGGEGCGTAGCTGSVGCGTDGARGVGGDGATVGSFPDPVGLGTGGGGGLFGGGGGGANAGLFHGIGGGGSSLVPPDGAQLIAALTDAPRVVISTRIPKYLALQIPIYLCYQPGAGPPVGTYMASLSYIDKGDGDRHLELTDVLPTPEGAGLSFPVRIGGHPFGTISIDSTGLFAPIRLSGEAVPEIRGGNANVEVYVPSIDNFAIASNYCGA